jgi:hypothetical protein
MSKSERMKLANRLDGALPREPMQDARKDIVAISAHDVALAVKYLRGEG